MSEQKNQLKAHYYPEDAGLPSPPGNLQGEVAVCFSGGGSRACTAAMGQMRGLHQLNLLNQNKIKCISSVSGGTWASVLYAYRSADIDIETFLGQVVQDPHKLTWDDHSGENKGEILDYLDFNNLGMVPTRLGIYEVLKTMVQLYKEYKYPVSDLWIRTVGKLVLQPFGLANVDAQGNPSQYMGYTQQWTKENPINLNPDKLDIGDFDTVADDQLRPYLITNTSVFANPTTLIPFEISPIYAGILNTLNIEPHTFGGGYTDSYVFGSSKPVKLDHQQVSVQQMSTRAGLADAAGPIPVNSSA